jgi:hypothetical protein
MPDVCTVVVRRSEGPPQVLAVRDELTDRPFDDPAEHWPELPGVVGGRDRSAGGTWCAVHVGRGRAALVLNRPEKRVADAGAPSRGVLPLLGVRHGTDWPAQLDPAGMASFLLVVADPDRLSSWVFDGARLSATEHEPGTHMFTSGGAEDGKAERYLDAFREAAFPDGWRAVVTRTPAADDPASLVVRHAEAGRVFATVFAQLFDLRPGQLELCWTRRPEDAGPWRTTTFG